jgi:ABC-type transporter Mla subunit MlaD
MDEENKETQETQQTQATQGTLEALGAVKAELQAEGEALRAERSNLEQALAEKDTLIAVLQTQLGDAKQATESLRAEGVAISEARDQAVSKYLEAARALNSTIPGDVIAGGTIEEIDASVEKAKAIADAVKANLEARAREAKVPAGAPARGEISLEGLSPREKIAAGLHQKGGT